MFCVGFEMMQWDMLVHKELCHLKSLSQLTGKLQSSTRIGLLMFFRNCLQNIQGPMLYFEVNLCTN